jgi:hypothetical protein
MTTYYLNGTALQEGADITLNGFTYPYSWLEGTSPSIRASLGIEKQGDVNYDPKYYWGVDNPKLLEDREESDEDGNPLYVQVYDPEAILEGSDIPGAMVDTDERLVAKGLKTTCTEEIKSTTNTLLQPTDYYIIRGEVEGLELPEEVSKYRASVIAEQERVVDAIATVNTVEELISIMDSISWEVKPDEFDPDAGLIV